MKIINSKLFSFLSAHRTLLTIIFAAALLRIYDLNITPPSLYWDEVSIGYNAYSIAQTGRDEWGQSYPFLFTAFGEYKLPGQIYLTVPFVKILGLSDFAVRLPAAIMGVLAIFGIYLITKQFAQKIVAKKHIQKTALFSALLLAVSPWHLQFSRAAFEANSAITLLSFGIYFLFNSSARPKNYFLSSVFFASSFYFYYHVRIVVPLILAFYFIFYFRTIIRNFRPAIISAVIFTILLLPILITSTSPEALKRAGSVSVIDLEKPQTNPDFVKSYTTYQNLPFVPNNLKDKLAWSDVLFEYYLRHLDPNFLFISGDTHQTRHRTPNTGLLYYFQIPLLLSALYLLIKKHSKESIFVIFLVFIFPIPAIFSDLTPHALRASIGALSLTLLSSFGVIPFLKNHLFQKLTVALIIISVGFYLYQYHIVAPKTDSLAWGYGHRELFTSLQKYNLPIIITGRYWNPYIYFLYYNKVDPASYQILDVKKTHYQNYFFAGADWDGRNSISNDLIKNQLKSGKNIIVLSPTEDKMITLNRTLIQTIKDKSNEPLFLIYEINY